MKQTVVKMNKPMPQTDQAFYFPQGIAGFSESHQFGLIYEGAGNIACLQSMDQPEAAFLLTPWDQKRLGAEPSLNQDQRQTLDIQQPEELLWMVVLNPFADKTWVTANLKAPIAINSERRIGLQCIRQEADLNLRYHWMPQPQQQR